MSHHILVVTTELSVSLALEFIIYQLYPTARVSTVLSGLEALEVEDQAKVDLIISTQNAGTVIDGLELTRILRSRSNTDPVILLSGNSTSEEAVYKAGVTLLLCPPDIVDKLKMALPKLLNPITSAS